MTDDCSTKDIFKERGISFLKLENLCYGGMFNEKKDWVWKKEVSQCRNSLFPS